MLQDFARVEQAIRYIDAHYREQPTLEEIARGVHLSPFHFQRLFTRWAGISPKRFLQSLTLNHAKSTLAQSRSVLDAAFDAGLSGPSRLHDLFVTYEAMTPGEFKRGGEGLVIGHGFHATPFGSCLIAVSARGLCGLSFADDEEAALAELAHRWPRAELRRETRRTGALARSIFGGKSGGTVNLLLRGTPFQIKVWEALLRIPPGALASYQEMARRLGKPGAARALGGAIGANPIAYLIPCHRVIRKTGVLGEYRWGAARKKAMLAWETGRSYSA